MELTKIRKISACRLDIPIFYFVDLKNKEIKNTRKEVLKRLSIEDLEHKANLAELIK